MKPKKIRHTFRKVLRPARMLPPIQVEYLRSGGAKIFPAIVAVLVNIVDGWADDVSGAVEVPRAHDQLYPLQVEVDETMEADLVEGLRRRGHNVTRECFVL